MERSIEDGVPKRVPRVDGNWRDFESNLIGTYIVGTLNCMYP